MAHYISRNALYDLVWSEPLKTLAPRFEISDVALRKACKRALIPTPDRGYWAKKAAGKRTTKIALPARAPGMNDELTIDGYQYNSRHLTPDELQGPLPPPPVFTEPIETVRSHIEQAIGRVKAPKKVCGWHPAIMTYFKADEGRKAKLAASPYMTSWYEPLFENAFEQRRFRLLNCLFVAVAKLHGKPTIRGKGAREIQLGFHQQRFPISVDRPGANRTDEYGVRDAANGPEKRLEFKLGAHDLQDTAYKVWIDDTSVKLESHLTEVAVELVLYAEVRYRERELSHFDWRKKRKAEIEEQDRQKAIAAAMAEQERLERLKQQRINSLLSDADAYRKASEIRAYSAAVSDAHERGEFAAEQRDLNEWHNWAISVADEIDPVKRQGFLKTMGRLRFKPD
jgi:hypothetical protein